MSDPVKDTGKDKPKRSYHKSRKPKNVSKMVKSQDNQTNLSVDLSLSGQHSQQVVDIPYDNAPIPASLSPVPSIENIPLTIDITSDKVTFDHMKTSVPGVKSHDHGTGMLAGEDARRLANVAKYQEKDLTITEIGRILGFSRATIKTLQKRLGTYSLKEYQYNEAHIFDFVRSLFIKDILMLSELDRKKMVVGKTGALWFNSLFNNSRLLQDKSTGNVVQVNVVSFKDPPMPAKSANSGHTNTHPGGRKEPINDPDAS